LDVSLYLVSKESTYTDMYEERVWYSLDALAKKKLGSNHTLSTLKKKRDWALAQGWEIIENKQGVEGVSFNSLDEGVMRMRVGSKFSAEKQRQERFDQNQDSF
jgi:hypothetical protein